ncbi:MAG: Ku protein [Rhodospirillales bacterium 20-64-7]|nr:MAG: Ku protein [Rhodospirillales bacterium 20-64-7]HQT78681.1 Ku protein [Rhodopila sp.]
MVSRPIWRGHLRLALVTCPIALHSVVRATSGLHFHLINPSTGHRIRMVTQDAETEEEVSRSELVKGYEFEKDRYVLLDEADFEQARIESSSILNISKFVEAGSIDPIYFDTSYYVSPDGDAGQDVFIVLRDAIRKARVAALSRVVIAQRERAVAITPSGKGLICHTLHDPHDLWDADPLWADIPDTRPEPDMVTLATQLIGRQIGQFQPDDTIDRYEARLREVIDAKLQGEGITQEEPEEPDRGNVIDLMAALKASLGQAEPKPARKRPAPVPAKAVHTKTAHKAAERSKAIPTKKAAPKRAS